MNPEPEQANPKAESKTPGKRTGVPVWRTGKPDAVLAAAVDVARTAIEGIAKASEIGEHLAVRTEGDRLVTHLFESKLPGYGGWQWYAVLTRNSRSKVVTVNELGLLPSEDSILAPEWVPWAERVRPEDGQEDAQADVREDAREEATDGAVAEAAADAGGASESGPSQELAASPEEAAEESDGGEDTVGQPDGDQNDDEAAADAGSPGRG
jgi:hypothetical protein